MDKIDKAALFKISYGLFLLTAKDKKDNGCIINTFMQITDTPKRIVIAVNKANYTHDMILKTGQFNVSVLTVETPFSIFQDYGFVSGRDVNKFEDQRNAARSENGLFYLTEYSNAFISGKIISSADYDTHTLFVSDVAQGQKLSDLPSVTYEYYFKNIKPKPQTAATVGKKKRYVCKICGYVYEGDILPQDYICPICKHGAEDFELLS